MKQILIADDEPHVIRVLKLTLEREGYAVTAVGNGEQALQQIRSAPPDVLITDIQMPRMTGRELCQAIEAEWPQRRFTIIVMTSMTEREQREWVASMKNIQFLEKPLSPRRLVAFLHEHFSPDGIEGKHV
jgi:CheY-like chemotaxis protein